ncbi:MAG: arylsulfatase [Verrucomicrobiota bacterium]
MYLPSTTIPLLLTLAFLSYLSIFALKPALSAAEGRETSPRANVILIMTDDQGYGDLACHGNPIIQTPHLDRLHADSVRLTNFHVDPACAPTRAGLMTGRYAHRVGLWHVVMGRTLVHPDEVTVAELFRDAGYRTGIFGKWHLGGNFPFRPQDQGFDEVWTHGGGVVGHTPDYWMNDYFDDHYLHNGKWEQVEGYCTDVWINKAIAFLTDNPSNKPTFIYLPLNAPHSPFEVPERFESLYHDNPDVPDAAFYGMITAIDEAFGRLDQSLKDANLFDNTIVIFMTDNGTSRGILHPRGSPPVGFNAGMRGKKGSPYEGGHRVPGFIRWPAGNIQGGRDIDTLTTHLDLLPTLCEWCEVPIPENLKLDGTSLAPLFAETPPDFPDRTMIAELQQTATFPERWHKTAVMTDRWRLVNETELYDIRADPSQAHNVSTEYPEIVQQLTAAYEKFWTDCSENYDRTCELILGSEHENPTLLTAYHWNNESGEQRDMPWAHRHIVAGPLQHGYWRINVAQPGTYAFRLRRWPAESNLKINEHADHLEPPEIPWHPLEPAKLKATTALLQIGKTDAPIHEAPVSMDDQFAEITVTKVSAGSSTLRAWFTDDEDRSRGAYYVEVERIEK